jgi:hypothetical protein
MAATYNVIDADGHVLEPFSLWREYTEPGPPVSGGRGWSSCLNITHIIPFHWLVGRLINFQSRPPSRKG